MEKLRIDNIWTCLKFDAFIILIIFKCSCKSHHFIPHIFYPYCYFSHCFTCSTDPICLGFYPNSFLTLSCIPTILTSFGSNFNPIWCFSPAFSTFIIDMIVTDLISFSTILPTPLFLPLDSFVHFYPLICDTVQIVRYLIVGGITLRQWLNIPFWIVFQPYLLTILYVFYISLISYLTYPPFAEFIANSIVTLALYFDHDWTISLTLT